MVTDLGAANHYRLEHLRAAEVWAHAAEAGAFFVGGFHMTVCPEAAAALGAEAVRRDVPFAMGFSAPFIPVAFHEALNKTLRYADFVLSNETEFASWAEVNGLAHQKGDLREVARAVARLPKENERRARVVVVTQGTGPTLVAAGPVGGGGGGAGGEVKVEEFPVRTMDPADITDTNGAGDAFAGGFLAGVVQGAGTARCVDMGQWLASLSLRELGPSYVLFFFFSPFLVGFLLFSCVFGRRLSPRVLSLMLFSAFSFLSGQISVWGWPLPLARERGVKEKEEKRRNKKKGTESKPINSIHTINHHQQT